MSRSVFASSAAIALAANVLFAGVAYASTTQPFTVYPAFRGHKPVIEAATDKGLIVELIVRCRGGAGILTYSKVESLYCGPDNRCTGDLDQAIARLCR